MIVNQFTFFFGPFCEESGTSRRGAPVDQDTRYETMCRVQVEATADMPVSAVINTRQQCQQCQCQCQCQCRPPRLIALQPPTASTKRQPAKSYHVQQNSAMHDNRSRPPAHRIAIP